MLRTRHVSVDLTARALKRDRIDLSALSDAVLAARARGGDREARDVLVERHAGRVERIARARLSDPEEARDAAQEALGRVVEGLGSFRGEAAFATWVHRVAANACTDHARRLARVRRSEVVDGPAAAAGLAHAAEPDVEPRGVDAALRDSLDLLTQPQRSALVLKAVMDMRDEDVANAMSLPVGTVKCHAHRGRKLLAARLRRTA
jgi:RNA polymerase sigma-70 factor (ECF subfamily)